MTSFLGIVDSAFDSFICIRGFATYAALAETSKPDDNYQRLATTEHIDAIRSFISENVEGRFFPEIVLGASWAECGFKNGEDIDDLLHHSSQAKRRVFVGEGSSFTVTRPSSRNGTARVSLLRISDKVAEKKPFHRIDGNHRLLAIPDSDPKGGPITRATTIRNQKIPFCLVLFLNDWQYRKNGAMFFHNINYRAVPIPEEKNLELILTSRINEEEYLFSDVDLKNKEMFGLPYYFARKIIERELLNAYPALSDSVKACEKTFLVNVVKLMPRELLTKPESSVFSTIQKVFSQTEHALTRKRSIPRFKRSMLEAIVYCFLVAKNGDLFIKWIDDNKLADIADVPPKDVVDIFEKTHTRGPFTVFVAMPYVSHKRVNDFNKLFSEALDELTRNGLDGVKYKLIPIMRFRGAAQRIDQRLIKCIKECDIFVADITGNNDNVIFEIGLAEGAGKPVFLIRQDNDDKAEKIFVQDVEYVKSGGQIPFDMDKLQYIPYSATGYYNDIKGIIKRHLPEIVAELQKKEK